MASSNNSEEIKQGVPLMEISPDQSLAVNKENKIKKTNKPISKRIKVLKTIVVALIILSILLFVAALYYANKYHKLYRNQTSQNLETVLLNNNTNATTKNNDTPVLKTNPFWNNLRLPRSIIPIHYNLTLQIHTSNILLNLSESTNKFYGLVRLEVEVVEETNFIVLHCEEINIFEASVFNQNTKILNIIKKIHYDNTLKFCLLELRNHLNATFKYEIQILYEGNITQTRRGLIKTTYNEVLKQKSYLVIHTKLEPVGARAVLPCFDEPDLKISFTISIIHQSYMKALSNMPVYSENILDNNYELIFNYKNDNYNNVNWKLSKFVKSTVKMSSYLLAIVLFEKYEFIEVYRKPNHLVRVWYPPDRSQQSIISLNFSSLCENFMEQYFNLNSPLPKTDHIYVPDFSAGAMENWGLITYRGNQLFVDKRMNFKVAKNPLVTIAHELVHIWFGNWVTMKWWNDTWLNEGFAAYFSEMLFLKLMKISATEQTNYLIVECRMMLEHDVKGKASPIIYNNDKVETTIFNGYTYHKGKAILSWLEGIVGTNHFTNGIRNYLKEFATKNVDSKQFFQVMQKASENKPLKDLYEYFYPWLTESGYPIVSVDYDINSEKLILSQKPFTVQPDSLNDSSIWPIYINYKTKYNSGNDNLFFHKSIIVKPLKFIENSDFILLNSNGRGYIRVKYSEYLWERLLRGIQLKSINSFEKMILLDDYLYLVNYNKTKLSKLFINLLDTLSNDVESIWPWVSVYKIIFDKLFLCFRNDVEFYQIRNYFIKLSSNALNKYLMLDKTDNDIEEIFQKTIIDINSELENPVVLERLDILFKKWLADPYNYNLPKNLARRVLFQGVRQNDDFVTWEKMWLLLINKARWMNLTVTDLDLKIGLSGTTKAYLLKKLLNKVFLEEDLSHLSSVIKQTQLNYMLNWLTYKSSTSTTIDILIDWFKTNYMDIQTKIYSNKQFDKNEKYHPNQLKALYANIFKPQQFLAIKSIMLPYKFMDEVLNRNLHWRNSIGVEMVALISQSTINF